MHDSYDNSISCFRPIACKTKLKAMIWGHTTLMILHQNWCNIINVAPGHPALSQPIAQCLAAGFKQRLLPFARPIIKDWNVYNSDQGVPKTFFLG